MLGETPIMADLMAGKIADPLAQKAFAYWDNVTQIGSWLALPPKVAEPIVATYVKAFGDTIKDPEYRAAADQLRHSGDLTSVLVQNVDIDASPRSGFSIQPKVSSNRAGGRGQFEFEFGRAVYSKPPGELSGRRHEPSPEDI